MKFLLFNAVVGTALVYLIIADRPGTTRSTAPTGESVLPDPAALPAFTASTPVPARPPMLLTPAVADPVGSTGAAAAVTLPRRGVENAAAASVPQSRPIGEVDKSAALDIPVAPPAADRPTGDPEGAGSSAAADAALSDDARGRSLRDLARKMEGRFLSGMR